MARRNARGRLKADSPLSAFYSPFSSHSAQALRGAPNSIAPRIPPGRIDLCNDAMVQRLDRAMVYWYSGAGVRRVILGRLWDEFSEKYYGRQGPESEEWTPKVACRRRMARIMHIISLCVRPKGAHEQEIHIFPRSFACPRRARVWGQFGATWGLVWGYFGHFGITFG